MNIAYIDYSPATKSLDIFFSGCKGKLCSGCCNPELIDFNNGTDWKNWTYKIEKYCHEYKGLIDNIFLLGGSPNHQNIDEISDFLAETFMLNPQKIWLFAREELDDILPIFKNLCEYIKTGAYIPELTCDNNIQYGIKLATSNQKIYKRGVDY